MPLKLFQDVTQMRIRIKRRYIVAFLLPLLICLCESSLFAYIMPAEQVIGLMTKNLLKVETMFLRESVHLVDTEDRANKLIFEQKVWLKAPNFIHRERMISRDVYGMEAGPVEFMQPTEDVSFRRLFIDGHAESLLVFLSELGVDLECVAYSRIDGVIAFRLGDQGLESPKLFIEKERFVPLMLCYPSKGVSDADMVTVWFDDYRKKAKSWYPYEIVYTDDAGMEEHHFVLDMQVNAPLGDRILSEIPDLDAPPPEVPETDQESPAEKRLREIIELFRKKYP